VPVGETLGATVGEKHIRSEPTGPDLGFFEWRDG
jgi:hypothetical protein